MRRRLPFLLLCLAVTAQAGDIVPTTTADTDTADTLYAAAIDAASEGDLTRSRGLLRDALEAEPDHEPTRAELGYVHHDGRWVSVDYSQHLAASDSRLREYEQRRRDAQNDLGDLRGLARWCSQEGLTFEARPHWLATLRLDPDNREALRQLNAMWVDGSLWDRGLAADAEERSKRLASAARAWEKRFERFERARRVTENDLDEIRSGLDTGAVEPIERRIARSFRGSADELHTRSHQLVSAMIDASRRLDDIEVTALLCRIAILGGETHRDEAIESLRERQSVDVMPLLLSALVAPIESEYRITRQRGGAVTYEHRLAQSEAEISRVHDRRRTADVQVRTTTIRGPNVGSYTTSQAYYLALLQARFEGVRNQIAYRQEAQRTDEQAEAYNRAAVELNTRVIHALTELTGKDLGTEPRAWWDHWRELTGYQVYDPPTERTYEVTYKVADVVATPTTYYIPPPPPPPPGRYECFVAGTPVWTRTGRVAVEDVEPGDLVLARDPHRGGLTYRVVLATTVRRPSPVVEIHVATGAGGETIHATVGHPFWVVGRGWVMAQELAEGDRVSTVEGPARVESVDPFGDREAFNLVVEGAANYYVGEAGVLVHDNTPRRPAAGLVAGR